LEARLRQEEKSSPKKSSYPSKGPSHWEAGGLWVLEAPAAALTISLPAPKIILRVEAGGVRGKQKALHYQIDEEEVS